MRKGALVTVVVLLLGGRALTAQETKPTVEDLNTSMKALKARLKDMQDRLDEMGNQASKEEIEKIVAEIDRKDGGGEFLDWLKDVKVSGDLRLRYEGQFRDRAVSNGKDRHRGRVRLRIGAKKKLADDQVEIGIRLATGGGTTSTNQTFDNNFNGKDVFVDRAYAKVKPNALKCLTVVGGKMSNPLVATDMVWDSDVNPEGVWAQLKREADTVTPFAGAGYFIVDEDNRTVASPHDTTLVAAQVGFDAKPAEGVSWTAAVTHYLFDFHAGSVGAGFLAGAGPMDYRLLNVTNQVKFKVAGQSVKAYFDYIFNCGNNDPRSRFKDKDSGYAAGVSVGSNRKAGDVAVKYKYAYIEPNCTVPGLADSDFGLGTGTNAKGHKVGATYNITDGWTISGTIFFTRAIVGSGNTEHTLAQIDSIWKW